MTSPKARVFITGALFLGWLGFLFYLVLHTKNPVIARPQFLIAQAIVVAEVSGDAGKPNPDVIIKNVLWTSDKSQGPVVGQKVHLVDLLGCREKHGYIQPGDYVIPLTRGLNEWQITPIPTPSAYRRHTASHAMLEIRSTGPDPESVLDLLLAYTKQHPGEAEGLLEQLLPALAAAFAERVFAALVNAMPGAFVDNIVDRRSDIEIRGILPRRLPYADAIDLQREAHKLGAAIHLTPVEVRIYPATPSALEQTSEAISLRP